MHAPSRSRRFAPPPRLPRAPRGRRAFALLALALAFAGVAALALLEQGGGPPQTAFARAPVGHYAVLARTDGPATAVAVVGADRDAAPLEIATVPHLDGHAPRGAVSPDGRRVALLAPDVAIGGRAFASLLTLDLETGELRRLAEALDPLQQPRWTPDSRAVLITRYTRTETGAPAVAVVRVALGGGETVLETHAGAVMVAPLGLDAAGRLLAVRLDATGSTLTRAGEPLRWLSPYVTRDWALSPDAARLAFVETNTATARGVRYLPRVVTVEPGATVSAASASSASARQALGAAWPPSGESPRFGREPSAPSGDGVSAQAAGGFDVPLGYSRDGSALAVVHWSGAGFDEPGAPRFAILSASGRQPLDGFTRFFGWSAR